ncbi:hypothetical protein ABPG72_007702 [Tetrahymena utriculariae]
MSIQIDLGISSPQITPIITEKLGHKQMGKLFLGSAAGASSKNLIVTNQIQAVLTIANESNIRYPKDIVSEHKIIKAEDDNTENISKYFDECVEFLAKNLLEGKNVLVHCIAGVSRSPSFVIAFLIKQFNWSYQRAYDYVKERRPAVQPNANFVRQLKSLDSCSRNRNENALIK